VEGGSSGETARDDHENDSASSGDLDTSGAGCSGSAGSSGSTDSSDNAGGVRGLNQSTDAGAFEARRPGSTGGFQGSGSGSGPAIGGNSDTGGPDDPGVAGGEDGLAGTGGAARKRKPHVPQTWPELTVPHRGQYSVGAAAGRGARCLPTARTGSEAGVFGVPAIR